MRRTHAEHAGHLVVIPTAIEPPLPQPRQAPIPAALDENRVVERQTLELHKLSHTFDFRVANPHMPRFKDHGTARWLRGGEITARHCTALCMLRSGRSLLAMAITSIMHARRLPRCLASFARCAAACDHSVCVSISSALARPSRHHEIVGPKGLGHICAALCCAALCRRSHAGPAPPALEPLRGGHAGRGGGGGGHA